MFLIYGKDNCQYCINSKMLLTNRNKEFIYKTLGEDYTLENLLTMTEVITGVEPKTFPQIFKVKDNTLNYVGGFTELRDLLNK